MAMPKLLSAATPGNQSVAPGLIVHYITALRDQGHDPGFAMKKLAVLVLVAASGCTSVSGPTKLARGADSGMWSSRPKAEVDACIARVAARGPDQGFEVTANTRSKTPYTSTVSVFQGDQSTSEAVARQCL